MGQAKAVTDYLSDFLQDELDRRVVSLADQNSFSWKSDTPPLALIAQLQRSGGTLVTRLLDGHPSLRVYPHELAWNLDDETRWPDLDGLKSLENSQVFELLASGQARREHRFLVSGYDKFGRAREGEPLPYLYSMALHRKLFIDAIEGREGSGRRDVLDIYLDSFFGSWLDYRDRYVPNKKFVVAFGKRHNLSNTASGFFDDYPDGRMITVVRDPKNWLSSAQRHNARLYGDTDTALRQWCQSAESSIELAANDPDRVVLITFEQLIRETDSTIGRIFGWLGVDPFADPIPTFNGMEVHSNSSFRPTRGIDRSALIRTDEDEGPVIPEEVQALYEKAAGLRPTF